METVDLIKHFDKMTSIAEMIISEAHRVEQLENLKKEKNWLFYSHDEIVSERYKYEHKIAIHKMALERLKNYYIKNSKLN
jgi:hypothetical protein